MNSKQASAQKPVTKEDYLQEIEKLYNHVNHHEWSYIVSVVHGEELNSVERKRNSLIKYCETTEKSASDLLKFKGKSYLKDELISYINHSNGIFKQNYKTILTLEKVKEESVGNMESYLFAIDSANKKLESSNQDFLNAIQKFRQEYSFDVNEKDIARENKMKLANSVYSLHHKIALIHFKCELIEKKLVDAYTRKDTVKINKLRKDLITKSETGLNELNKQTLFLNDSSIIKRCAQVLDFYLVESDSIIPKLISYYKVEQKFEQFKADFDAKDHNKQTKEDFDKFDAKVQSVNHLLNKFNIEHNTFHDKRNEIHYHWQRDMAHYARKHIIREH